MLVICNLSGSLVIVSLCCSGLLPGAAADESGVELTVKEAIVKAVDLASGHNIFNRNIVKHGAVSPDYFRSVEVLGAKESDGSITVRFGLPISSTIDSKGRMTTKKLLEVRFTDGRAKVLSSAKDRDAISEADDDNFRRAIAAVLCCQEPPWEAKRAGSGNRIEFAVMISRLEQGLLVLVHCIPYVAGGHTGYTISKDNQVLHIGRGR